jgi:hypothetical protein
MIAVLLVRSLLLCCPFLLRMIGPQVWRFELHVGAFDAYLRLHSLHKNAGIKLLSNFAFWNCIIVLDYPLFFTVVCILCFFLVVFLMDFQ